MTLNLAKCEFIVTKVKVLGHVVSAEGISADPQKTEAIRKLPTPKNVADVRSFLGMVNHVIKLAKNLASKTKPLRELLKKEQMEVETASKASLQRNQRNDCISTHTFPLRPKQRH